MTPRLLDPNPQDGDLFIKTFKISILFDEKQFKGKSLITEESPVAIANNKSAKPIDFLGGDTTLLIISDRAKNFFEKNVIASKIEFVPVKMENYSRKVNYWVLNILEITNCFDWEKSQYTLYEELAPNGDRMFDDVTKVIFNDDKVGDRELFYSYEFPVYLFISEKFEKKLIASDLNGFEILDFTFP